MRHVSLPSVLFVLLAATSSLSAPFDPIALHPENPHYFLWRGKPTILITSGEHYGAVLNRAFDYEPYLATLQSHGFNLTRTFSGAYCEPVGAFKIENNTLAPAPGNLLCPWARSDTPGYANGGNKFDLTQWDRAVLPAADGLRRGGGQTGHRRRAGPVLPLLRGLDVATEPDERPQQRQRRSARSSGPKCTRSRTAVCWPCRTRWCSGSSRP